MQLYGLKSCDTTRKALKTLREAGKEVTYIDVRVDGVPNDVLRDLSEKFGDVLVNKRSTTWRGLTDSERAGDSLELLAAHPTLMKRPVVRSDKQDYLGWTKDVEAALIG